jgi:V8-like Glu-specific endopeptidase
MKGLFGFCLWALVVCLALPVQAENDTGRLRKLLTADEARAWQAVGRLNIGRHSFCTGALVAPDLVLTAAHCLFNPDTGRLIPSSDVEFLAGWRNGRAVAYRKARRFVVSKSYDFGQQIVLERVANDVALIELDRPIRDSAIIPFKRYNRTRVGENVMVVSYAKDRSEVPSIEEPCNILDADARTLVLSCHVNFGASGSPIFVEDQGVPKIASVVSAMAKWRDRDVSLGVSLGDPLDDLIREMTETSGVFRSRKPGLLSLQEQLGTGSDRAKFFSR